VAEFSNEDLRQLFSSISAGPICGFGGIDDLSHTRKY